MWQNILQRQFSDQHNNSRTEETVSIFQYWIKENVIIKIFCAVTLKNNTKSQKILVVSPCQREYYVHWGKGECMSAELNWNHQETVKVCLYFLINLERLCFFLCLNKLQNKRFCSVVLSVRIQRLHFLFLRSFMFLTVTQWSQTCSPFSPQSPEMAVDDIIR